MTQSERLNSFLADYEDYIVHALKPTQQSVKDIFKAWKSPEYWKDYSASAKQAAPTPIQRCITRIKRPESVLDKIYRKPESFPDGLSITSVQAMRDTLGGRAVVYFLSALPIVDKEIRNHPLLEICKDDPPVAYLNRELHYKLGLSHIERADKDSGYSAIHYILRLRESDITRYERPCFELQVRTLTEDIWSEIEHVLGYKPNKRTSFAVRRQFQMISRQLETIDEQFSFLYEELIRFQDEIEIQDTDSLNAENLPRVLTHIGAGCAQREMDGLLKLLASRKIATVKELVDLARPIHLEVIKNTYRAFEGREPNNFEIVANLANIRNLPNDADLAEMVRAQIDYLNSWERIKGFLKNRTETSK